MVLYSSMVIYRQAQRIRREQKRKSDESVWNFVVVAILCIVLLANHFSFVCKNDGVAATDCTVLVFREKAQIKKKLRNKFKGLSSIAYYYLYSSNIHSLCLLESVN